MKRVLFLLLLTSACTSYKPDVRKSISLAGEWKFRIDSLDVGLNEKWYNNIFDDAVKLPGSMAENGKGYDVTLTTEWTGDIIDKSYFKSDKYQKFRQPSNIKVPFWLQPVKYYKGAAWYQKEFDFHPDQTGKNVWLYLERPHWESTVFVNGRKAGSENSLAVAHKYNISDFLTEGINLLSIRMDNRVAVPVGVNAHSISDHTQSNWNGIAGDISLKTTSSVFIHGVSVYPDLKGRKAKVIITLANTTGEEFKGKVILDAESFNSEEVQRISSKSVPVTIGTDELQIVVDYPLGNKIQLWSEFNPALYRLNVFIKGDKRGIIDHESTDFGMREFKANGTYFEINGQRTFLRGTLECCIFPLTGYPPTDIESWEKVLQTCKDYGLNTIRFHSWCPPEAAFIAADKLGMYFHIECSAWANMGTSLGDGGVIDSYIYSEGDKILEAYGNHPSFCMLAYGNEPAGDKQSEYLGRLLSYWKTKDNRHLYTSAAGWPFIPENDFNLSPEPRIQRWGEGLKSIINSRAPQTFFDYRDYVSKFSIPVVSHEIGQWCAYPDFKEIEKYTGVLKAKNFEIFRETLEENNMGDQAEDFMMASGKLQVLCYKADIEAALRTPGFAGFHLLQLHDFPGQGTALVGILNAFFESKGYISPEEFRKFSNSTVPLARMRKMVYYNNETIKADIEVAHFSDKPLVKPVIKCCILDSGGEVLDTKLISMEKAGIGNCIPVGSYSFDLSRVLQAQKLILEVSIENSNFKNNWDFWVYPSKQEINYGSVLVTDNLTKEAEAALKSGGSVLLLTHGKIGKDSGAEVAIGFSSIFWNTAWTSNQPPHTLGILCDPSHEVFSEFPTEFHSNWQWWDPVSHSQVMILDEFPADLKPLIQPIDTWFENRRLALAFEARVGNGKLMVCSIDLMNLSDERPVSKQLFLSILKYMNSGVFNPQVAVKRSIIEDLLRD